MTAFHSHPDTYQGLPYLASITIGDKVQTAVVDFVMDDFIHYYHLDALDVTNCSAFLTAVEEYHNTGSSKLVPLSVFISSHNYSHVCAQGYRMAPLDVVAEVEGLCPHQWFQKVRIKWRRKDMVTGQVTASKHRRTEMEKEADRVAALAAKAERKAVREQQKIKAAADKAKLQREEDAKVEKIKAKIRQIEDQAKQQLKAAALAEKLRVRQLLKDQTIARRLREREERKALRKAEKLLAK